MSATTVTTKRIRVYGIVQGVGFRPTVDRHATTTGIAGTVCNKGPYVEIYAQGSEEQIDCFVQLMHVQPPRRASMPWSRWTKTPSRTASASPRRAARAGCCTARRRS